MTNRDSCKDEAQKEGGRWVCHAESCPHRRDSQRGGGCMLGKVSLTCDDNDCNWNVMLAPGIYGCRAMDIHLDAQGRCLNGHD
ncbi:hypothetical protein KKH23_10655 [Patescibacteria group bacterium]|nr:hypothetical protein [Patescibacteria group bacterium]